jgi:hypothetical protein
MMFRYWLRALRKGSAAAVRHYQSIVNVLKNIRPRSFPPINFRLRRRKPTITVVDTTLATLIAFFHYYSLGLEILCLSGSVMPSTLHANKENV